MLPLGYPGHDPIMDCDTKGSISLMWPTYASSCGEPDDPNEKTRAHRGDTEKVGVRCAF